MRCEARTLDDIRALGGNDAADERRFATAARVSEINLSALPHLRAAGGACAGQSGAGRMDAAAASAAAAIRVVLRRQPDDGPDRGSRRAGACATEGRSTADNPFARDAGDTCREQIVTALDAWRTVSETLAERTFVAVYGSPALQAAVGIDPDGRAPPRKAAKNPLHRQLLEMRIAELKSRISGGRPARGRRRARYSTSG